MSRNLTVAERPRRGEERTDDPIIEAVLERLYAEYEQAQRQQQPAGSFPVKRATLLEAGLTDRLIRRWQKGGLVVRRLDDFFLTEVAAQQLGAGASGAVLAALALQGGVQLLVPDYDEELRELRYGGRLVKGFGQSADSQEPVLIAFETQHWRRSIQKPLSAEGGVTAYARLHEAIRGLNKYQKEARLEFHGDGTGCGVRWSPGKRR